MRTIFLSIVASIIFLFGNSQTDYNYYYENERIYLEPTYEKVSIQFARDVSEGRQEVILKSAGHLLENTNSSLKLSDNLTILDIKNKVSTQQVVKLIEELNRNEEVVYAGYFFKYALDGTLQGLNGRFSVKLSRPSDFTYLEEVAKETKTQIINQNEFDKSVYVLSLTKNSTLDIFELSNYFHETGRFEFAEPSFIRILQKHCVGDPFFGDQWGLKNTGQNGGVLQADIKACEAWEITKGSSNIKIAVIDEGVDLSHVDLVSNILSGYDATGLGSNGASLGNDAHGTACAGIIAASDNNGNGISGIAPNCKILPVRIAINDVFGNWITTNTQIANGINWSWQNGADVLSNSWGGGSPSSEITTAINNAFYNGRDGLGCPIFFSAGNDNDTNPIGNPVSYPANLSNVIAIGAMSMCNQRKQGNNPSTPLINETSCDGESNWASNYGSELSFVAPGVKIITTDITGSNGYSTDNYYGSFNGTSAACPHAAGTAALVLSVNRCLSAVEVRRILELSCDKVGLYCYSPGKPHGSWNNEMGYGRLNALKSVQYAYSQQVNSFFDIAGVDMSTSSPYTWSVVGGGCLSLAAATYSVKRHEIVAAVSYPFTQSPICLGSANGLSLASPNSGNGYMQAWSVTNTNAILKTWVYEVVNILGQTVGWVPCSPSEVRFNFTVLSMMAEDIYLQNQNISLGNYTHNAMDAIRAGYSVTTSIPYGNYNVTGTSNITIQSGNSIFLEPGVEIVPTSTGQFIAKVEKFFTCSQYPSGMILTGDDFFPPVAIANYEVDYARMDTTLDVLLDSDKIVFEKSFNLYPNPARDIVTIEYKLEGSDEVRIDVLDNMGRVVYSLENIGTHDAGLYQVRLSDIQLPQGVYQCVLSVGMNRYVKKLLIAK